MRYLFLFLLFCSFQSAEKILSSMTIAQKIGQLFVLPACPLRDEDHKRDLSILLKEYHIGGIILKQGNISDYRKLINFLNSNTKYPLIYYADAEWGLGMRISDAISYPKNHLLGLISDNFLITLLGKEIGRQCRSLGIHVNLAPVVDIRTNPTNAFLKERSFGDNPQLVSTKAVAFYEGLKQSNVYACAKHFPGLGDSVIDPHYGLPIVSHDLERLKSIEFSPFQALIDHKIPFVMTAHICMPQICSKPCTFSYQIVTKILKEQLGFEGIVITDALNMKALTLFYPSDEIGMQAFLAGHDQLLYGDHIAPNIDDILRRQIPEAYHAILSAYFAGIITEQKLNEHVLKILKIKENLFSPSYEEINTKEAYSLQKRLL